MRRITPKVGEGKIARRGVLSCAIGLVFLSLVPLFVSTKSSTAVRLLQAAAVCFAFTSATVVSSLTSYASLQCDGDFDENTGKPTEEHPQLAKGAALGKFRSSGQLGRALGPLLGEISVPRTARMLIFFVSACASYWTYGPTITYAISAVAMIILSLSMVSLPANPVSMAARRKAKFSHAHT